MSVNDEFISTVHAKEMKDLGFDEKCLRYSPLETYITNCQISTRSSEGISNSERADRTLSYQIVALPTWRQAFNWFYRNYNLYCCIEPTGTHDSKWIDFLVDINKVSYMKDNGEESDLRFTHFRSRDEAELWALEKIIQIAKEKGGLYD